MGAVIKIGLEGLADALERGEARMRKAIANGALAGAHRGRALIVKRTPVDQGQLKAGWKVTKGDEEFDGVAHAVLATLINNAPTISMVELGSRPHAVNPEGWRAIYEWTRRHFRGGALGGSGSMRRRNDAKWAIIDAAGTPWKGPDPVITQITNAIVWKIRKQGTKATLFVRNSLGELGKVMAFELERAMATVADDIARGGKP